MTDHQDPPRWSEAGPAPAELARLLSAARSDGATQPELAQLSARLGPILGATPAAPLNSTRLLLVKAGVGLFVAAGLVTTALLVRQRAPTSDSTVRSAAPGTGSPGSTASESAPLSPAPAEAPVVLPPAQTSSVSVPASSSAAPAWHQAPSQVAGKSDSGRALDEATLLEQARSALGSNPSDALALTQKHRVQFRHGVLAQEREVIAISALRRLGRTPEAEARAARFDQKYPNSAHQQSVDRRTAP